MISKTIGFRGTRHFQTHPYENVQKARNGTPGSYGNHPYLEYFQQLICCHESWLCQRAIFPCFAFDVSCLRTDKSEHRVLFHINFHIKHALKWLFAPFSHKKKKNSPARQCRRLPSILSRRTCRQIWRCWKLSWISCWFYTIPHLPGLPGEGFTVIKVQLLLLLLLLLLAFSSSA